MNAADLVTTLATALGQVFDMLMHLGSALMLGALIGLERQWSHHPAGLKTNALVSLGAASFCLFALNAEGPVGAGRVGAQIVSGIGFLGGGVILREGFNIRGLNTAATLWCSAAVGALSGGGQFLLAAVAATLIVGTNIVLLPIATVMNRTAAKRAQESLHYVLTAASSRSDAPTVRTAFQAAIGCSCFDLHSVEMVNSATDARTDIRIVLHLAARNDAAIEGIIDTLADHPAVTAVGWRTEAAAD